jgi:hypothetical protein
MFKRRLWVGLLVTLITSGALVLVGFGAFRAGWRHGYGAGQVAAPSEEGGIAPWFRTPFAWGRPLHRPYSWSPIWPGLALLRCLVPLLFALALISGMVHLTRWRVAGGASEWWIKHHGHGPWRHPAGGESVQAKVKPDAEDGKEPPAE